MNFKSILKLVAASVITLYVNSATAAIINLEASLSGAQEVPANLSPGTGFATVTLDDISNLLTWDISWSGLSGNPSGMHFHGPAPVGTNAGVQVNIGAISGLTSPSAGSTVISTAQSTDLLAGLWYINIHTLEFTAGEIRGQVEVVPVPAAVWLFGSGLLGLIGVARRKQSV